MIPSTIIITIEQKMLMHHWVGTYFLDNWFSTTQIGTLRIFCIICHILYWFFTVCSRSHLKVVQQWVQARLSLITLSLGPLQVSSEWKAELNETGVTHMHFLTIFFYIWVEEKNSKNVFWTRWKKLFFPKKNARAPQHF